MTNKNTDPYKDITQVPVTNDIIAGFTYKYLGNYINTKVEGIDFLPLLYSVMHEESSGMKQFVKAYGSEQSFGIFQINWGVHQDDIVALYPQFRDNGIAAVDVDEMSKEQYDVFVNLIADLDFQFSYAKTLMDRKEAVGRNIFEDWSAYTNGNYTKWFDSYVPQVQQYKTNTPDQQFELVNSANSYSPSSQVAPQVNPIDNFDPAESNIGSGEPVSGEEQFKQIKQYYGGEFYDYQTDKWIGDYQNFPGFKQFDNIFNFGYGDAEENTSFADWFSNTGGDNAGTIQKQWNAISAQSGFFNPFQLSALRGAPTTADMVMMSVYQRFVRSASNAGFSAQVAQAAALKHLANPFAIDAMRRAVTRGQQAGLTLEELIDDVSNQIRAYTKDQGYESWEFRLPLLKDSMVQEQQSMNAIINKKVTSVLLEDNPHLTDTIRQNWTDYKIANPNTSLSLEAFAMPFIENTDRYNRIYRQKPAMFSPEQYINQYVQGVGSYMATGDPNYENMIASQASLGGTMQEAQTGAMFGSASVGLADTFRNKVNALTERVSGMFGD